MGNSSRDAVVKIGDVVEGRYRIIKTLGEGGMGTVFLAEHALIKRRVAIKILHQELATDANVIERFMNEARAAGTLGHPNIVESTDMGFTGEHVPYIVFEYLEGSLLTDEIYRVGGLPVRRAVHIAQQIASALHAAHNANIVHRDLKSDNVFLTDRDEALDHVKVLDFGISRFLEADDDQSHRGMVMGTPEFMAPEQITSPDHVDKRADIYALGVILYEMVTARRPFSNDEDPRALMHRIVNAAPPPMQRAEVPHAMQEMILHKLLAKDPAQRYQNMLDVEAALDAFVTQDNLKVGSRRILRSSIPIQNATGQARALETPWPPTQTSTLDKPLDQVSLPPAPPAKRPWALYGLAAAGVLVGGVGLVIGMRGDDAPPPAPQAAIAQPAIATPAPAPEVAPAAKISIAINANVPNARVTFRRRVAPAPATMELAPSDIVELVEVSAPGHKTVRYWLTFDRATTLNAKLAKGTGLEEASEEATLIALGEITAPTARPAAAAPTATPSVATTTAAATTTVATKVVAKTEAGDATSSAAKKDGTSVAAAVPGSVSAVATAPRKIGKGAADTQTPTTGTVASSDAASTTPATDSKIKTDATATTEVASSQSPAPIADPPAKIAAEVPKETAPAVAKPVIAQATLQSVVGQHRPEILKCFSDGKKKNPNMKGTLTLQLQVDPTGKVRAQVQSTLNNPLVAACAVRSASAWRFPARDGGDAQMVSYPFTIQ